MGMKTKKRIGSVAFHTVCIIFAITSLYPILWLVASSLKESSKVFVDAASLIPETLHFENYTNGWRGFGGITFTRFFANTFFVVILTVLGVVVSCPFIAYGFSRVQFKFKKFWFTTVMFSMMLPGQIIMVPQYIMFNKLGMIDTYIPLILPAWLGQAFFIFQHMQFISSIPYELDEAALLDGCGKFRTYTHIILPLLVPSIVTTIIFQFYWAWDNFFGSLIYLTTPSKYVLSIALRLFSDPSSNTDWGALFAMGTVSLIPPILLFFIFQRYIVEGVSTSGLKG